MHYYITQQERLQCTEGSFIYINMTPTLPRPSVDVDFFPERHLSQITITDHHHRSLLDLTFIMQVMECKGRKQFGILQSKLLDSFGIFLFYFFQLVIQIVSISLDNSCNPLCLADNSDLGKIPRRQFRDEES